MKKIIPILLVIVVAASACRLSCAYWAYSINYNYIKTTLCENRKQPAKHCNGKCHLKKELAQQEKQESKMPEIKSGNEVLFFTSEENRVLFVEDIPKHIILFTVKKKPTGFVSEILRPPATFF